jgi:hypothetical protein
MVEPADQALYVMQNEFGAMKIGRSLDVEGRRRELQSRDRCRIAIVRVFPGCGHLEEDVRVRMRRHQLTGDWFVGTEDARASVCRLLGVTDAATSWPFGYDETVAVEWLVQINAVRNAAAVRRDLCREIALLRAAREASPLWEACILRALHRAECGRRVPTRMTRSLEGGGRRLRDEDGDASGDVPDYTANVETALTAWPEDIRPPSWDGTAIEGCIAALTAVRERLPKVPRIGRDDLNGDSGSSS